MTASKPYRGPERRSVARARLKAAFGTLGVSGFVQVCNVRDLSPRGVGVGADWLPQPGQRVSIGLGGLDPAPAVVIWRKHRRCGLAFQSEQDLGDLMPGFPLQAGSKPGS